MAKAKLPFLNQQLLLVNICIHVRPLLLRNNCMSEIIHTSLSQLFI